MNPDNFFDLWGIFVNEVIGDYWLFVIIGIALIAWITLKYRMPFQVSIAFVVLWLLLLSATSSLIYVLILTSIGLFTYAMMARFFRRG